MLWRAGGIHVLSRGITMNACLMWVQSPSRVFSPLDADFTYWCKFHSTVFKSALLKAVKMLFIHCVQQERESCVYICLVELKTSVIIITISSVRRQTCTCYLGNNVCVWFSLCYTSCHAHKIRVPQLCSFQIYLWSRAWPASCILVSMSMLKPGFGNDKHTTVNNIKPGNLFYAPGIWHWNDIAWGEVAFVVFEVVLCSLSFLILCHLPDLVGSGRWHR